MARRLYAQGRCITDNLRIVRGLIETHAAAGILPEHMCGELLGDPRLRATPLERRQDVWLLVQNHLKRDPASRAVIAWMRESFAALSAG
jgi:DNA-binding transcriptional LysR family regulator